MGGWAFLFFFSCFCLSQAQLLCLVFVGFLLQRKRKRKKPLKKSPTFFCSYCVLDLSLNGEVAAEEERQTDTQTWAFRPRFFIQGPKCSRVVVVVAAAAAAQQQSVSSN
jgi:hypothetical protein